MNFLKKLFGIDEILKNINEVNNRLKSESNNKLVSSDSFDIITAFDKAPLLRIENMLNNENRYYTKALKPIGAADKILSLIQYLPLVQGMQQSKMLEGAYKVVFPEGAVGQLMKYKNGTLGTPLVQPNGEIGNTHAGLVTLQNMPISPLIVFTAMSAITGQYFMAKINKSLEKLSEDVKEIICMILDDKESRNKAILNFYDYVRNNFDMVLNNSDLRIATLTNLQSFLVDLKQNQLFYEKTIERKNEELNSIIYEYRTTNSRIKKVDDLEQEVSKLMIQQHVCLELYLIGKMYEMQLAQIFDDKYCIKLIDELNICIVNAVDFSQCIIRKHTKILDLIDENAIINIDKVKRQKEECNINFVDRIGDFECNVKETVNSIKDIVTLNMGKKEFLIKQGELYYVDNTAS